MSTQDDVKKMWNGRISRRRFLGGAAAAVASGVLLGSRSALAGSAGLPFVRPDRLPEDRPAPQGTLTWLSAEAFAGSWDPTQHMILANFHAEWNAFDRLFQVDPNTGDMIPMLGLTYKVIPEGLEFTLRKDVKFHNGKPFTAEDVKYTFERYTDPANVTSGYFPGQVKGKVIDDYTVQILTDTPLPVLNLQALVHVHSHFDSPDQLKLGHNGTGPFKFVKYEGETITYDANMDYWMGPPRIKEVHWTYVGDPSTRLAALQKGEADVIDRVPGDHVDTIKNSPDLQLIASKSSEYTYLNFKIPRNEFTGNELVRQAFSHCIDRKGIAEGIMSGYATVPESVLPYGIWPFGTPVEDAKFYPYDLEMAKQKLEQAGFPGGEGLPEFQVIGVVGFYANMKEYMEYISAECKKVGINIQLEIKETAAWQDSYFGGKLDCDAIFIGWANMSPEPDELLLPFFRSGNTVTMLNDPALDKILSDDATMTDRDARAQNMKDVVIPTITEKAITIPIVGTMNMHAASNKVKGYTMLPNSCFALWDVSLEA